MTALILFMLVSVAQAKQIALSFDDAPQPTTPIMTSLERTMLLNKKLNELNISGAMIFANACKGHEIPAIDQLRLYFEGGHVVANHTCSHLRLDSVGSKVYVEDIIKNDEMLKSFGPKRKYFRYPYLNEGKDLAIRDEVRNWLASNNYVLGSVSVDNDDYYLSSKLEEALRANKKVDWPCLKKLFLKHLIGSIEFYDNLAVKTLGRSPKHVLLLHERDVTVKFLDSLVTELRDRGWDIISAEDAYKDEMYKVVPKNTYGNNGIIAQIHYEKTQMKTGYPEFANLEKALPYCFDSHSTK